MAIHRFGVIDKDGTKINTILLDPELAATGWYPGYGAGLIDEGPEKEEPQPEVPARPDWLGVVSVSPDKPMQTGDKVNLKTGAVTKAETQG